ncbi:MAG: pro-sigmaK processing inhibitor BofA family protein [Bacilli bacterium]
MEVTIMLKKIFILLKRVVISAFILYGYNLIASPLNLIIPINIFTVGALTILGIPAIFSFIIILVLIF